MEPVRNIFQGKLFGHPVHIMMVHFPAALFPVSAVLSLLFYILNDKLLSLFNFYLICSGSVMGWCALIFGTIDLIKISANTKPFKIALLHGGMNTLWISIFTVIAVIQFKYYPAISVASFAEVVIEIIVTIFMLYSNYLGGELVIRYGIGSNK